MVGIGASTELPAERPGLGGGDTARAVLENTKTAILGKNSVTINIADISTARSAFLRTTSQKQGSHSTRRTAATPRFRS